MDPMHVNVLADLFVEAMWSSSEEYNTRGSAILRKIIEMGQETNFEVAVFERLKTSRAKFGRAPLSQTAMATYSRSNRRLKSVL